jgi:hypothetical protein
VVQFRRADFDDVTWHVERATSLPNSTWVDIATKPSGQTWTGPATVQETDNGTIKTVIVTDSTSTAREHYIRLRVTQP